jgi:hypothetical protein
LATSEAAEKAGLLFQIVKGLGAKAGLERSFKVVKGRVFDNRFLLGVSKKHVGPGGDDRLIEACGLMGMPETLLDLFRRRVPSANYVHFGFEQNDSRFIYKVYLEFIDGVGKKMVPGENYPKPALLHLGLKWDVSNPAGYTLTRYTWHPWLSSEGILQRTSCIPEPNRSAGAGEAAAQLVSLALGRIPDRDILYLEVTEEDNPRLSFDINVYRANLQVAEVYPLLSMLGRRHLIPFEVFHSLYDSIKTKRFGHLAAGIDREGNSFFTVYYGVEAVHDEAFPESMGGNEGAVGPGSHRPPLRKRRFVRVEETDDKARRLFRLVKDLNPGAAFERSFKFLDRLLLTDRFLLGFKRSPTAMGQDDAILDICRHIDMPEEYRERFQSQIHDANMVLFGFESNERSRVYKAYLEFNGRLAEVVKEDPRPESVVIYTGFKWDALNPLRKVVSIYRAFPLFRAKDMSARILSELYGGSKNEAYRLLDDILDLAGSRTQPGGLLYFEVREEGNHRSSFDINLYRADLQMAEIYSFLLGMARHYSIDPDRFEELYEAVKTQKFGHLSGGTDREGKDFLTVYFSEKGSSRRQFGS